MSKNEVAVVTGEGFRVATINDFIDEELMQELAEDSEGLRPAPFDKIKIPSGGGMAFEVPIANSEEPEIMKELNCIILYSHHVNSFWPNKYDGSNETPTCSSIDGLAGINNETGEFCKCAECKLNKFTTDDDGIKRKKCKNMCYLYILLEGNPFPYLLVLPPSSLAAFDEYKSRVLGIRGKKCPSWAAVTKIALEKSKNDTNIVFSKAKFSFVDYITGDKKAQLKQYRAQFIDSLTMQNIIIEDDLATPEQARPANEVPADGQFHEASAEAAGVFTEAEEAIFEQADAKQEELPV